MKPAASGLEKGFKWEHGDLNVVGYSLAGITNTFTLPKYGVSLDVGQGLPFHMGCRHFFITHGHMDHAHGMPYIIGQKNMMGHPEPQVYMLHSETQKLNQVLRAWSDLEDHTYRVSIQGLKPGDEVEIQHRHFIRSFSSAHRVPTLGYGLVEKKKKLRKEFKDLKRDELLSLKAQGITLDEDLEETLFTYSGDTSSKVLKHIPDWVLRSQVLALDVTFWDDRKDIEQAQKWGHFHARELPAMLEAFQGERLLIVHISARHNTHFAWKVLKDLLTPKDLKRVDIFPRPY